MQQCIVAVPGFDLGGALSLTYIPLFILNLGISVNYNIIYGFTIDIYYHIIASVASDKTFAVYNTDLKNIIRNHNNNNNNNNNNHNNNFMQRLFYLIPLYVATKQLILL